LSCKESQGSAKTCETQRWHGRKRVHHNSGPHSYRRTITNCFLRRGAFRFSVAPPFMTPVWFQAVTRRPWLLNRSLLNPASYSETTTTSSNSKCVCPYVPQQCGRPPCLRIRILLLRLEESQKYPPPSERKWRFLRKHNCSKHCCRILWCGGGYGAACCFLGCHR
jgi:hypothetical protein